MCFEIRDATEEDCRVLSETMRADDRAEILASSGRSPYAVLMDGLTSSIQCRAAFVDDAVMCIWGTVPYIGSVLGGRVGCIWMLTSDLVDRYPKLFMRHCKKELRSLLSGWLGLFNRIDCRHYTALRWGKHLGFQFEKPEPYGVNNELFVGFMVTLEDLDVRANYNEFGPGLNGGRNRDWYLWEDQGSELSSRGR